MSVFDVDNNIESIDDNIRRVKAEKLEMLMEHFNKEIDKSIKKQILKTLYELGNDNHKI